MWSFSTFSSIHTFSKHYSEHSFVLSKNILPKKINTHSSNFSVDTITPCCTIYYSKNPPIFPHLLWGHYSWALNKCAYVLNSCSVTPYTHKRAVQSHHTVWTSALGQVQCVHNNHLPLSLHRPRRVASTCLSSAPVNIHCCVILSQNWNQARVHINSASSLVISWWTDNMLHPSCWPCNLHQSQSDFSLFLFILFCVPSLKIPGTSHALYGVPCTFDLAKVHCSLV